MCDFLPTSFPILLSSRRTYLNLPKWNAAWPMSAISFIFSNYSLPERYEICDVAIEIAGGEYCKRWRFKIYVTKMSTFVQMIDDDYDSNNDSKGKQWSS